MRSIPWGLQGGLWGAAQAGGGTRLRFCTRQAGFRGKYVGLHYVLQMHSIQWGLLGGLWGAARAEGGTHLPFCTRQAGFRGKYVGLQYVHLGSLYDMP